jgi:hypothetical protein
MEQDKINLANEKERRERDCKNMQNELNRISSMVHVRKIFLNLYRLTKTWLGEES